MNQQDYLPPGPAFIPFWTGKLEQQLGKNLILFPYMNCGNILRDHGLISPFSLQNCVYTVTFIKKNKKKNR